jgi:hypothetical protein
MTEERRYQDDEVKAIFAAAAEADASVERPIDASGGLTLPALREIGREVGIAPERIDAAARDLDQPPVIVGRRTYLGLPVAVGRTVLLPRGPTDREWALLVAELRATFGARGRAESEGELREWSNGNLRVSVEPTETAYRLRMRTVKGSAVPTVGLGLMSTTFGVVTTALAQAAGAPLGAMIGPAMLLAFGVATAGSGILRLPSWARDREEQMAHIIALAQRLIGPEVRENA